MNKSIVCSSKTGNTKKLAEAIDLVIGEKEQLIIFVGFWTDKGTADAYSLEFLKSCKNKKIFLFGTCGFGGSTEYYEQIINRVKGALDDTNEVVGWYMCQGKMPQSVRDRYITIKNGDDCPSNIDDMIDNFDKALLHPNDEDIEALVVAVKNVLSMHLNI